MRQINNYLSILEKLAPDLSGMTKTLSLLAIYLTRPAGVVGRAFNNNTPSSSKFKLRLRGHMGALLTQIRTFLFRSHLRRF